MRSAVRICPAAPKSLENFGFQGFFVVIFNFSVWVSWLTHTVTHTQKGLKSAGREVCASRPAFLRYQVFHSVPPGLWYRGLWDCFPHCCSLRSSPEPRRKRPPIKCSVRSFRNLFSAIKSAQQLRFFYTSLFQRAGKLFGEHSCELVTLPICCHQGKTAHSR